MIQELLGGNSVGIIGGERSKLSTPSCGGAILDSSPSHNSPSSSSSSSSALAAATAAAAAAENLRCPRCDSANTKFCYYNNYNLTQPRHFCKTCRRYWTKGGALRNVPIGGGCRKNKSAAITAAVGKSSSAGKLKTVSSEMGRTGLFNGFEHAHEALPSNPIMWASSQNSHFLSLLRGNQSPNPSHLQNSLSLKEEGVLFGSSHFSSEPSISNICANARAMGIDHLGPAHLQSMALSNSLYRNQVPSGQGIVHGEIHNNGVQELYHRLRSSSSSSSCYPEHAPAMILGNMGSANSSATTSAILESAPVASGEMGFWNPTLSWPTDLPTTNGAYP